MEFLRRMAIFSAELCLFLQKLVRGLSTTTWTEFCHSLTTPPPSAWGFYTVFDSFYTLSVDKNRHFLTPSPPHLVHVVIE